MEFSEDISNIYSGKSIAKNTIYNLLGYSIPLLFALVLIPFLIKGLGKERFGILSLTWVVIGYFSFFDLGIGRALTKIIAEKIGTNRIEEIPKFFWTSFFLMLLISIVCSVILLFFVPTLVFKIFTISEGLQDEALNTFYILALSIPIVTTTVGIRGVLEAYQNFKIINIIRTFLGVFSFLGPLLCLFFTTSLYWIVLVLVIIRIIVWILYLSQCFKLNSNLKNKFRIEMKLVKPIFKLSGWMTVSNITVPLIVYLDRFLIGGIVSASIIAYYTTPYEIISRLLIIPSAVTTVLFPIFSASYIRNPNFSRKISVRAVKYIILSLFPIIFTIFIFSTEGLNLWLGKEFAKNSSLVLQLLAIGLLFNSIAYIPFAFLEGIGRPDITAKIQITELFFYFFAMWFAVKQAGINGAAFVWVIRTFLDALLLFFFAKRKLSVTFTIKLNFKYTIIFLVTILSFFIIFVTTIYIKIIFFSVIISVFSYLTWKYFLAKDEKMGLVSLLKIKYAKE